MFKRRVSVKERPGYCKMRTAAVILGMAEIDAVLAQVARELAPVAPVYMQENTPGSRVCDTVLIDEEIGSFHLPPVPGRIVLPLNMPALIGYHLHLCGISFRSRKMLSRMA